MNAENVAAAARPGPFTPYCPPPMMLSRNTSRVGGSVVGPPNVIADVRGIEHRVVRDHEVDRIVVDQEASAVAIEVGATSIPRDDVVRDRHARHDRLRADVMARERETRARVLDQVVAEGDVLRHAPRAACRPDSPT